MLWFPRWRQSACLSVGLLLALSGWAGNDVAEEGFRGRVGEVAFIISRSTGAIESAEISAGKVVQPLLGPCRDRYHVAWDGIDRRSDESQDRVIRAQRQQSGSGGMVLKLICQNDPLDLRIEKTYFFRPGSRGLVKRVALAGRDGFVDLTSGITLAPAFRAGGTYFKPSYQSNGPPRLAAEEVDFEYDAGGPAEVAFVNPQRGWGLATYPDRVNGHTVFGFAGTVGRDGLTYTPDGWQIGTLFDRLGSGHRPACEVCYVAFAGGFLTYAKARMADPELQTINAYQRAPDWAKRVKLDAAFDASQLEAGFADNLARLAGRFGEGCVMATLWGWYGNWGDYFSDKSELPPGLQPRPTAVKEWIRQAHAAGPHVKVGLYNIGPAADADSVTYAAHPEFALIGRDGQPVRGGTSDTGGPAVSLDLLAPGYARFYFGQMAQALKRLDGDFIYLDGGGGNAGPVDWKGRRVVQPYQWYDHWRHLAEIAHTRGRAVMHNLPIGLHSDCGYYEANWWPLYANQWPELADRLVLARLYSQPGRGISFAGYQWEGGLQTPETRAMFNLCLALGLRPGILDVKQPANQFRFLLQGMPYINAAYEVKDTELVDADARPNWWNADTPVQVHALRQGSASLLTAINHASQPVDVSLSVAGAGLGLDPEREAYVWLLAPEDPLHHDFSAVTPDAPVAEIVRRQFLGVRRPLGERVEVPLALEPGIVRLVALTHVPAVLTRVGEEACQCWLPETRGVRLTGSLDREARRCEIQVDAPDKAVEMGVYVPEEWGPVAAVRRMQGRWSEARARAGRAVVLSPARWGIEAEAAFSGERFLRVATPAGRWTVVVETRSGAPQGTPARQVKAGQEGAGTEAAHAGPHPAAASPASASGAVTAEPSAVRDSFDGPAIDSALWVVGQAGGTQEIVEGRLHLLGGAGEKQARITTVRRFSPQAEYEFRVDFLPPASEMSGYAVGLSGPQWQLEFGGGRIFILRCGQATTNSADNLPVDTWYVIEGRNQPGRTKLTVTRRDTGETVFRAALLHEDGFRGGLMLWATTGQGEGRGAFFDRFEAVDQGRPQLIRWPADGDACTESLAGWSAQNGRGPERGQETEVGAATILGRWPAQPNGGGVLRLDFPSPQDFSDLYLVEFWLRVVTSDSSYNLQYALGDDQGFRFWPDYHRSGSQPWTRLRLYAEDVQCWKRPDPTLTRYFGIDLTFLEEEAAVEVDGLTWWRRAPAGAPRTGR
jgi:hypothetical protein